MPDVDTGLAREYRILGVFLLLLGAGLILDCQSLWFGSTLLSGGALVFGRGLGMERRRTSLFGRESEAPVESRP